MEVAYSKKSKEDRAYWKNSGNKKVMDKITALINNISQTPYTGLGKPEALKHELSGYWSRRINKEHRVIYEILEDKVLIHSLRGHY